MNTVKKNSIALTLGAVVVGASSFAATDANANPFEFQQMQAGYQLDAAEGKCGEGKCGGDKKAEKEGKCGEGKCGGDKKAAKEGKCGEGKCGADKKAAKEGKCGEGKC
ncbi:hypothetical protein L1264_07885, partial [Pseudoalteromonas sp. APAL1]|nr:hypothetical protein [Pseudoalteromonas sp. APAL1]